VGVQKELLGGHNPNLFEVPLGAINDRTNKNKDTEEESRDMRNNHAQIH
jgi:hypothetical protein